MRHLLMTTALICTASLAWAEDAALIVGISDYDTLRDVRGAQDVVAAGSGLRDLGFRVFGSTEAGNLQADADDFSDLTEAADRLVVVLAGRFVTDGTRTWLMPQDVAEPAPFSVANGAVSVETALAQLAQAPGAAVLVLGHDAGQDGDLGNGLRRGIGELDIPSGVTVVQGGVAAAADLLADVIATPGGDIMAGVRDDRGLTGSGFMPSRLVLVPAGTAATPAPAPAPAPAAAPSSADLANVLEGTLWDAVRTADTQDGYARYLDRYPNGAHVDEAVSRLRDLRDPSRALRAAEEALDLPLEARRAIQRDLQVLGFDTRGIDGIFGAGSRSAIRAWQGQNSATQTGYLTAEQITRIDAQAARISAEREAQAQQRRAAEERADRTFWEETGATGTQAGLQSYLERYPDGQFATSAKRSLDEIRDRNRASARGQDRQAWDRAVATDNRQAYRTYLDENPNGSFRDDATAKIAQLNEARDRRAQNEAAREGEQQLGLDPIALRLVETRLAQLGLEPGTVDGQLDGDTRAALRRFQRDRELTASGFLDQATVSQMLRDVFR